MIPRWQLPGFKAFAERTMTETCVIQRPYTAVSDAGDYETSWNAVATVAMRMLPDNRRMSGDTQTGGKETGREYKRVVVPAGTDLRDGDRLLVDGVRYEVLRLNSRVTDKTFITADVARIETA